MDRSTTSPKDLLSKAEAHREAAREAFVQLQALDDEAKLIEAAVAAHDLAQAFVATMNDLGEQLRGLGEAADADPDAVAGWELFHEAFPDLPLGGQPIEFATHGNLWTGEVYAVAAKPSAFEISTNRTATERLRPAIAALPDV